MLVPRQHQQQRQRTHRRPQIQTINIKEITLVKYQIVLKQVQPSNKRERFTGDISRVTTLGTGKTSCRSQRIKRTTTLTKHRDLQTQRDHHLKERKN
jgi:hypothetical protein